MPIPSSGEISMNLFNTDRGIASGTEINLAAAGTAYSVSYTTDGNNDLQMLEFRGKSSIYWTANRSGTFTRNNCPSGYQSGTATYTKSYTSYISQANANALASGDSSFNTEGQAYANANGSCTLNLTAVYASGCTSAAPGKGYINISSFSGGSGTPYTWRYKIGSEPDSSYSNWIYGTGTTGGILANGVYTLQIRDGVNNIREYYSIVISCNYPSLTATVTSGGTYSGEGYIRVTAASGGSGAGYYWYLSTNATQRAIGDYAYSLANGEHIVYLADNAGNVVSFNPITFNLPPAPNLLAVTFREGSTAPSGTNGGCSGGTITNLTVEMPQGQTFENASSFIASYFTSFPSTVVIGYLVYNGRYVPIGKAYGGTSSAMPFGSRANCPTQVPSYGPVSPAEYQCSGTTKQQKYHDGNGGYTWVNVETNSSYCGYVYYPEVYLGFEYDAQSSCSSEQAVYYIGSNDATWKFATEFYSFSNGTGSPSEGYYSDGAWIRYWDGASLYTAIKCDGSGGPIE